jgi:hypothetical protein
MKKEVGAPTLVFNFWQRLTNTKILNVALCVGTLGVGVALYFSCRKRNFNKFRSISEIQCATHINGISITELERRAKPINDNTTDETWNCRSFDGFLGEGEKLKNVLIADWQLVQSLNISHHWIAATIESVLMMTESKRSEMKLGHMTPVMIEYQSDFPNSKAQQLVVERKIYMGDQFSLFYNEDFPNSVLCKKWNEEYIITNLTSKLSVIIAGNYEVGIVNFIEHLGFYEGGGSHNPYRIDPKKIFTLITGIEK